MSAPQPKVFFITGTSAGGLGHLYAAWALSQGHSVVATSRDASKLDIPGTDAAQARFLALTLDITSSTDVDAAFSTALDKFGRVDVVVNNAGYGLAGAFETLSEAQIRAQFDVNVHGSMNVTRTAIRVMREGGNGGLIQQISSIAGHMGVPYWSAYCSSKAALQIWTEALAQEMHPDWKIKFTTIEPGAFDSRWWYSNEVGQMCLEVYADHMNVQAEIDKRRAQHKVGDPHKAVQRMCDLALLDEPPARIVLGSDAWQALFNKSHKYLAELEKWKDVSRSTDKESRLDL